MPPQQLGQALTVLNAVGLLICCLQRYFGASFANPAPEARTEVVFATLEGKWQEGHGDDDALEAQSSSKLGVVLTQQGMATR